MIQIALYKGKSTISRLIRWQTRSQYSHAAALLDDGSVIEAWHIGGVRHAPSLMANHTPGTQVDIYTVPCAVRQQKVYETFLVAQIGKKYDFKSVFRFASHVSARETGKWFCSELVTAALNEANLNPLARINPAEVSPQLLSISPELKYRWAHGK